MIDLLRADCCRLKSWGVFYLSLICLMGGDLLNEVIKRGIQKKNRSFSEMMISGTEQKMLFLLAGILLFFYINQERESGFQQQTEPLCPKWKQIAEKLLFGAMISFLMELFFFIEHLAKVFYFRASWTEMEIIQAEAFWIGSLFLCIAFAAAGICLAQWIRQIWGAAAVFFLFVWGWPLYFVFEKMTSVVGGAAFLPYGMFQTFLKFCQDIREGTFLQVIGISLAWTTGFGGFAFLGRLRR